jgi:hypothetical protein
MSARETSLAKAFILFLLVITLAGVVVFQSHVVTTQTAQATSADVVVPVTTPTPTPTDSKTPSSDGTKVLYMRSARQTDGMVTYTVFSANASGAGEHLLFSKTIAGGALEIPQNAWSPDDSYIFVRQQATAADTYYVLKSGGDPFAGGEQYLDVNSLWTQRNTGFTLRDATGWASGTLLILYTTKADGTKGPAYWFEAPSKAFIQLAS